MSKETLKNKLNKVITLAKEHMVVTVVTCSVVAGGAVVGGVVAYNHAHADNEQATKIKITSAKDNSYVELKVRYLAVKGVIGELILDDVMSAKLPADAEEIRAYIENSNTKSVEKEMLEKMDELEANVEKETENSVTKLETKEKEVAALVATTNAPKFTEMEEETSETTQDESTEETKAVILDDATLVTLDDLKKEYFSLKKANKYKSAYGKCGEIIDLIKNHGAEEESTEEKTTEETTEAETSEEETTANGSHNSDADTGTDTTASAGNGSENQTQSQTQPAQEPQTQPAQKPQTQAPTQPAQEQPTQPQTQPAQEPQTQAPTQAPAEQPTENKAGVAETFYDGSVANGITAEEKAYIDGLVQNWLNGGCTNAELEQAALDYLVIERGYNTTSISSVKNSQMWIPNGQSYTLESKAVNTLYYYGKCYTNGEVSGDGRNGYYTVFSIS